MAPDRAERQAARAARAAQALTAVVRPAADPDPRIPVCEPAPRDGSASGPRALARATFPNSILTLRLTVSAIRPAPAEGRSCHATWQRSQAGTDG